MIERLPRDICLIGVVAAAIFASQNAAAQSSIPVVPGGEGFGMTTRAAYACGSNPTVYRVTNLNDSGSGSLRDALVAAGPRVVIFETSGTISLTSDVVVASPCLTIAGQTAQSPGVQIKGFGIVLRSHDILIQHLRIRPGDGPPYQSNTAGHDGVIAYTTSAYSIVFDHNSFSWAQGKNTQAYGVAGGAGITWWRNIVSEALYKAKNVTFLPSEPASLGMLLNNMDTGVAANISVIGNLFAHNADRNPEFTGPNNINVINNVIYDWGKDIDNNYQWASVVYAGTGPSLINLVGNKYIAGPPPIPFAPLIAMASYNPYPGTQMYMHGNAIDASRQTVVPYYVGSGDDPQVGTPPVSLSGITVRSSASVESFVLANAGARPADRDSADRRIVSEVTNRSGGVISSQDNVGGWPALATNTRALSLPSNPHSVGSGGYTNLEIWLQGYAAVVEGSSTTNTSTLTPPSNVRIVPN